jgi:hypothetical protein
MPRSDFYQRPGNILHFASIFSLPNFLLAQVLLMSAVTPRFTTTKIVAHSIVPFTR